MIKQLYWHYPHLKFLMGGTAFVLEIISELQKKKIQTVLITQNGQQSIISEFQKLCQKVVQTSKITTNDQLYWIVFPFHIITEIIQTAKGVRKDKPGVLFATLFPSNLIMAVVAKLTNRPYFFYCYEPFPFFQNTPFINTYPPAQRIALKIFALLYGPLDSWAVRQAKVVFTLNSTTKRMIKKVYGVDSMITLMGVDCQLFRPREKGQFAKTYSKQKIIVHSTDYTKMKNTDIAIKIFAEMNKIRDGLVMIITSTRPEAKELENLKKLAKKLDIAEKVIFKGLLSKEDLAQLYSDAWLYISTSTDEMLGTTSSNLPVKQALASGTPVIRANVDGDDVEDGISGFLIDPHQTMLSAQKGVECLQSEKLNKKMGLAGREKIKRMYNWESVTNVIVKGIYD